MLRSSPAIVTPRLELVPVSVELARAQLRSRPALGRLLDARIPKSWPPSLVDATIVKWMIKKMDADANWLIWGSRYFVFRESRTLVGFGGFKGPPCVDGTVEVGYAIVEDEQQKGYATEAVQALCHWAFSHPPIRRVIAGTYPDLGSSISVLEKCHFTYAGEGSELGMIYYERLRKKPSRTKF